MEENGNTETQSLRLLATIYATKYSKEFV